VHNVSDDRQTEIHTAEPSVPGPSRLEVEIAAAKLTKYKSHSSDQILTEMLEAAGETMLSAIHRLISAIWNKEELPDQWMESIIAPIHVKGDKTGCNNYLGLSLRKI
jgi:hypothetical protein